MLEAIKNKLYDTSAVTPEKRMFSNHDLWVLLIPLIIEQLLNSFMGMADTMMVSTVGEDAISAVSLVDSINNLVIQVFAALAAGATILCSQHLGKGDKEGSNRVARQVALSVLFVSVALTILCLLLRAPLLRLIFGEVEQGVMDNSLIYFPITVASYPFLALFNAGASFYRAGGNSKFPMAISVISNILNVGGNAFFIFVLGWGVAGAALATLLSRVFSVIVIFAFLRKDRGQPIVLNRYLQIRPDFRLIGMILAVGIPSGIENGMFQFGKLAIQSTVSSMGTTAIAAQAMTNILELLSGMVGVGIGIGLMTVVGQCIGAGRKEEAKYYILKLTWYAEVAVVLSGLFVMLITKPVTWLAAMESESAQMCFDMMLVITIVKPFVWVPAFVPAYGLRAAGDVKFSMIVSTVTMWCFRVLLCIVIHNVWHIGPMAVWIGMFTDWGVRGVIFTARYLSGRWLKRAMV